MSSLAIAFSGPSNSGKTTLIVKVANALKDKYKLAIVKHDPSDKAVFDKEGKDSWKFSQTGAEVVVASPTRTTFLSQRSKDIDEIISMLGDFDILLVEGLKTLPLPRLSVFRNKLDESYFEVSNALAIDESINLEDYEIPSHLDILDLNDTDMIVAWVLKKCKEGKVMNEIFEAIKKSAIRIKDAIEYDDTGYSDHHNATGDTQLKLDIKSDLIIEEEFKHVTSVKEIVSEEKDEATPMHENGKYLVGYDPLDGSSLIDVNLSVGSIFGIYEDDYAGSSLKASVYVVYGPRVELVIATDKVRMYRLNKQNEFIFQKEIVLNQKGKLNAPGATQMGWSKEHKAMVDAIFQDGYRLRYSGGMVPDLHQILLKGGGLFSYPSTTDVPKGKLRMIFEVFPFAFVYEKAGGKAVDGKNRLLDLAPMHAHDTTPCFFGSNDEIQRVLDTYGA